MPRGAKVGGSGNDKSADDSSTEATPTVEIRFLTLDDVATYLNVSVPQAYALVRSGDLPAIKLGGRGVWRIDRRELESYVAKLHKDTARWAREHPLNPRKPAD